MHPPVKGLRGAVGYAPQTTALTGKIRGTLTGGISRQFEKGIVCSRCQYVFEKILVIHVYTTLFIEL